MLNNKLKKFYPQNKNSNIIVEVCFLSSKKEKHKCAGVLIKEDQELIRVGFSAKNNSLVDFVDILNKNIIDIKEISKKDILVI